MLGECCIQLLTRSQEGRLEIFQNKGVVSGTIYELLIISDNISLSMAGFIFHTEQFSGAVWRCTWMVLISLKR